MEDEEDVEIVTVGSVVTLKVTLKRQSILDLQKREEELKEAGLPINSVKKTTTTSEAGEKDENDTTHHEVHCPYYPLDKYECWYLYLVERKSRRLVSMVVPCKTLDKEKSVYLIVF